MKKILFTTVGALLLSASYSFADEAKRQAKLDWLAQQEIGVVLWQHPQGNGETVEMVGVDLDELHKYGLNDAIDAIYYKLPVGYRLRIYEHSFFKGHQVTFRGTGGIVRIEGLDKYYGDSGRFTRGFHDQVSSVKILDPSENN